MLVTIFIHRHVIARNSANKKKSVSETHSLAFDVTNRNFLAIQLISLANNVNKENMIDVSFSTA